MLALVESIRRRLQICLAVLACSNRALRGVQQGLNVAVGLVARAPDFVALMDDAPSHIDALIHRVGEDPLDGSHEVRVALMARFERCHLLVGENLRAAETRCNVLHFCVLSRHHRCREVLQEVQEAAVVRLGRWLAVNTAEGRDDGARRRRSRVGVTFVVRNRRRGR